MVRRGYPALKGQMTRPDAHDMHSPTFFLVVSYREVPEVPVIRVMPVMNGRSGFSGSFSTGAAERAADE